MTDDEKTAPEGGNNPPENELVSPQASFVPPATPVTPVPVTPVIPAAPAQAAAAPVEPAQSDFTKILKEVKLPERRDFKASADIGKAPPASPEAAILQERIIRKTAEPTAEVPEKFSSPGEPEKNNERSSSLVVPVRTLKDDLQSIVREQKISLVHAATLEEEKKHGQEHLAPEQE